MYSYFLSAIIHVLLQIISRAYMNGATDPVTVVSVRLNDCQCVYGQ